MRFGLWLVMAGSVSLAACAVQTAGGRQDCKGEVPYVRTTGGQPVTTHTGGCIDEVVTRMGTARPLVK